MGQADVDSDGAGDDCDCAPSVKGVSTLPGHLAGTLRIDKTSGGTLTWKRGPQGHVSNVYRGTFTAGQAWTYDETCFDTGNADTEVLDPANPANPGEGYYYLVSGANTCGEGPAGADGEGVEIVPTVACTAGSGDSDSDGLDDYGDNCANDSNAAQEDPDADFVGTACDNCPAIANADQSDLDLDGEGDVCDDDDDGDGVIDTSDNCPVNANTDQSDQDSDGAGDLCDPCTDIDSDGLGGSAGSGSLCDLDPFPYDPENDADGDGIAATGGQLP